MVPLWVVIVVSVVMFTGVAARMISSSSLMSALPAPMDRGSYMAISASIQQISGGIAASLAGWIVIQNDQGQLEKMDLLGDVVALTTVLSLVMMFFIDRYIRAQVQHA